MRKYQRIEIAGGDTGTPLNVGKRLDLIESLLPRTDGPARVLDAGCGSGEYVEALTDRGYDAIGVEFLSDKVLAWNEAHPGDERVKQGDIASLELPTASIDAALMNEVLEHVPSESDALKELRRVIRPGGVLIVFGPNRVYPFDTHGFNRKRDGTRIAPVKTFGLPWLPRSILHRFVDPWARNYFPWEMRSVLRGAGFEIERTTYVWQTFENISGKQPKFVTLLRPALRIISSTLERVPLLRSFGVSQVIVAKRA